MPKEIPCLLRRIVTGEVEGYSLTGLGDLIGALAAVSPSLATELASQTYRILMYPPVATEKNCCSAE